MKLNSSTTDLNGENLNIAVVLARFNDELGNILYENTVARLKELKVTNIQLTRVPGSLELPLAAQLLAPQCDAVIALGIVIKGETPHFDHVCNEAHRGLMDVNLKTQTPVIFGVITALNEKQARDRVEKGGLNKGKDFAEAAVEMAHLTQNLQKNEKRL